MKFVNFFISRGFAIFLLIVSVGLLVLWNKYPGDYFRFFLIIPAFLLVSLFLCTVNRIRDNNLKGDIRFWGSIIFHFGMIVIIIATSFTTLTRFFAIVSLPKGVSVTLDNKILSTVYEVPFAQEKSPFVSIKLENLEMIYANERFPVEYIADLSLGVLGNNGYHSVKERIEINRPLSYKGYNFLLESGGYSPRFVLKDKSDRVLFNEYLKLSNSSSAEDMYSIKETDLIIYTRFFPDMFIDKSKVGSRSPIPRNPAFGIRIVQKDNPFKDIWRGVLKEGETARFDNLILEFADLRAYVIIQIIKDPTYWGIVAGWILIMIGLTVKYFPFKRLQKAGS